ncbi:MAG TPA: MOSC domain-containing protein, partial [Ardenticatenaceae bacterium]
TQNRLSTLGVEEGTRMKVVSLNVGLPRQVPWKGEVVTTGIFKEPVAGRVTMRTLNLDGDRQADLTVHGGVNKAVYLYPSEHYGFWRQELPEMELAWGVFGENITSEGLLEEEVYIGDRFRIGSAEMVVTQPRFPCYKLGLRFGDDDMLRRFLASRRSGIYFAVTREGEVGAGDRIELISRDPNRVSVTNMVDLYVQDRSNVELLRRAVQVAALPDDWRNRFNGWLTQLEG